MVTRCEGDQWLLSQTFPEALSRNRPVPLTLIQGVISKIPPFVMSQQGRTNLVVWDIARATYLIKAVGVSKPLSSHPPVELKFIKQLLL
ncbi:unnamed protein product [Boreogadus saida]